MEIRQGYSYHIKDEFFDLVYTIQEQPVTIHKKLDKLLVENLNEVLAMYNRGIKLDGEDSYDAVIDKAFDKMLNGITLEGDKKIDELQENLAKERVEKAKVISSAEEYAKEEKQKMRLSWLFKTKRSILVCLLS